jgi:hypothetical protein
MLAQGPKLLPTLLGPDNSNLAIQVGPIKQGNELG